MNENKETMYYATLRDDVGKRFGKRLETATDFVRLSQDIADKRAGYLSVSTLKRFWGYINDSYSSRRSSTLDILARYVGKENYVDYVDSLKKGNSITSDFNTALSLDVSTLSLGQRLEIRWFPDRVLSLTYIGDLTFRIDRSINSKLQEGMKIRCLTIVKGQPLIVNIVNDCGAKDQPMTYLAGKVNGIDWLFI